MLDRNRARVCAGGRRHRETLCTVGNLADCLRAAGRTDDALAIFGNVLAEAAEALGMTDMTTLVLGAKGARLRHARAAADGRGSAASAAATQLEQVVLSMRRVLGPKHPQTCKYESVLEGFGHRDTVRDKSLF